MPTVNLHFCSFLSACVLFFCLRPLTFRRGNHYNTKGQQVVQFCDRAHICSCSVMRRSVACSCCDVVLQEMVQDEKRKQLFLFCRQKFLFFCPLKEHDVCSVCRKWRGWRWNGVEAQYRWMGMCL